MSNLLLINLATLASLLPATAIAYRRPPRRDAQYWLLIGLAVAGPLLWSAVQEASGWKTSFATALWVTIAASMVLYAVLSAVTRHAWRLGPLLMPYLLILALSATIWSHAPGGELTDAAPATWIDLHIAAAVATYSLLTLAAVAGTAVVLQETALKRKQRWILTGLLPSIADAERLEIRLLAGAEVVLGVGIASGMAARYFLTGATLAFDHKTVFTIGAFLVIGLLLLAHYGTGLRGRRAAQLVLLGYLLLTLGYPGVKFVRDVLLG